MPLLRMEGEIEFEVKFSNSVYPKVICKICGYNVRYVISGHQMQGTPFSLNALFLRDDVDRKKRDRDAIHMISKVCGLKREDIKRIIEGIDYKKCSYIRNIRYEVVRFQPYEVAKILLSRVDSEKEDWNFNQLSSTEQYRVILDLMITYLSEQSQYRAEIFLIDWSSLNVFGKDGITKILKRMEHLSDNFQIVIATVRDWGQLDIAGWNISNRMTEEANIDIKKFSS